MNETSTNNIGPIPLAALVLDAFDAREFPSTLPVPADELLASSWSGITSPQLVMSSGDGGDRTAVLVSVLVNEHCHQRHLAEYA